MTVFVIALLVVAVLYSSIQHYRFKQMVIDKDAAFNRLDDAVERIRSLQDNCRDLRKKIDSRNEVISLHEKTEGQLKADITGHMLEIKRVKSILGRIRHVLGGGDPHAVSVFVAPTEVSLEVATKDSIKDMPEGLEFSEYYDLAFNNKLPSGYPFPKDMAKSKQESE